VGLTNCHSWAVAGSILFCPESHFIDQTIRPLILSVFDWLCAGAMQALGPMGAAACGVSGQPAVEMLHSEWQPVKETGAGRVFYTSSTGSGHEKKLKIRS
jgi:hypothetical protein